MRYETILGILEAISVGDALGMPTEFMGRREISRRFGLVDRLLPPSESKLHKNLPWASVTDDTEQVLRLLDWYLREGVDAEGTARCLLRWIRETKADERGYVGPTSLKALAAIEAGTSPLVAGRGGNTCGGLMRTPAAVLACPDADEATLARAIIASCVPTHNSSAALEAAVAFGFALRAAGAGGSREDVIAAALRGALAGAADMEDDFPPPSSSARIRLLAELAPRWENPLEAMTFLHDVLGAGLPSWEVCPAIFGIFLHAGADTWLAVKMGASMGGDTDTIAAMAGALCAAFAGSGNLPPDIVEAVTRANRLDLQAISLRVAGRKH
jgi:ADP-ribosylglycohydrolase